MGTDNAFEHTDHWDYRWDLGRNLPVPPAILPYHRRAELPLHPRKIYIPLP